MARTRPTNATKSPHRDTTPARQVWPDLVRVIAIAGVVAIHSWSLPDLSQPSLSTGLNWGFFSIAKTAVPLFLMLSGALLLGKQEPTGVFFIKRLRRILLPWLFWTGVFVFFKHGSALSSLSDFLHHYLSTMTAEFSFLPALFCLYLFMPYSRILMTHTSTLQRWTLIGWWFLGISLLPFWRNSLAFPAVVDNGLVRLTVNYSGFLLLGFQLQEWWKLKTTQIWHIWISLGGLLMATGITLWLQSRHLSNPPLFLSYVAPALIIGSVSTFVGLMAVGKWWQNSILPLGAQNTSNTWLRQLSQTSFGVFFLHPLIVPITKAWVTDFGWTSLLLNNLLIALSTLYLSYLMVITLRKIDPLKSWVS